MKYLVNMDANETPSGPMPATLVQAAENLVFPSFEALRKLEADRKITGGVAVGERRIVFIAEAADNAAVDKLIEDLPIWGLCKVQVTALNGFNERYAVDKVNIQHLK